MSTIFYACYARGGLLLLFLSLLIPGTAQTVFWSETFDAPAGGAENNNAGANWSLNAAGSGSNQWFMNDPSNVNCVGGGRMIYISCSDFVCGFFGGPGAAVYNTGYTTNRSTYSPVISTVGRTNITLSFTYVSRGSGNSFGKVMLSSDGGTTWNELPDTYNNTASCTPKTITLTSEYENIPDFRIGFRWQNGGTGNDPPFSVDNIKLSVPTETCTPPVVNAGTDISICPGESVSIGGAPTASGGAGGYSYAWSPATGLSSASVANPVASPSSTATYTVTVTDADNCTATGSVTVTVRTPQPLTTTPAGSQSICEGQTLSITAAAGFTEYAWTTPSGPATGQSTLAAEVGAYSVSAKDANGCSSVSAPVDVTIQTTGTLNVTPSGPQNLCPGSTITLTADEGFDTYTWSNGTEQFTGRELVVTEPGTYSVTGEGGTGCDAVSPNIEITESQAAPLEVTADGSLTLCRETDVVVLTAADGYTGYEWNGPQTASDASITVNEAGTYVVSAIDQDGCTVFSAEIEITNNETFVIQVTPSGNVQLCNGESIELSAEEGLSDYTWSDPDVTPGRVLTVSDSGSYTVVAQNSNGCEGSSEPVFVSLSEMPEASFDYVQPAGYLVEFSSTSENAVTYEWVFINSTGDTVRSNLSNPSLSYQFEGFFPVTLIVSNGCGSDTILMNVEVKKFVGLQDLPGVSNLEIFPVPFEHFLQLNLSNHSSSPLLLTVTDLTGKLMVQESLAGKGLLTRQLDLGHAAKGMYFIHLQQDGRKIVRKVIKQ